MSKPRNPTFHRRRDARLRVEEQTRGELLRLHQRLQALADQALLLHLTNPADVRLLPVPANHPDDSTEALAAALALPTSTTRH